MTHSRALSLTGFLAADLLCLALAGCVSGKSAFLGHETAPGNDPAMMANAAQQLLHESQQVTAGTDAMRAQLQEAALPAVQLPAFLPVLRDPLEERIVSIDMYEARAEQFLWAIAKDLGFNLVIDPQVLASSQRASLYLNKVSAAEAMDAVARLFDLHGTRQGNTIRFSAVEQRLFPVDLLGSKVALNILSGGDVLGADGGERDAQRALRGTIRVSGDVGMKEDAFDTLLASIEAIALDPADGKNSEDGSIKPIVTLDRRSQTLFVRARPSRVRQVSEFLAQVNAVRRRQVQIDMQIIDVSLNQRYRLGIDWTSLSSKLALTSGAQQLALEAARTTFPNGSTGVTRALRIPEQLVGQAPGGGSGGGGLAFSSGGVSAVANALRTYGTVKLISNPTLRARSGEPAFVSAGTNYRYVSKVTANTTATGNQAVTAYSTETSSLFSGLMVGLTPAIREDGSIELFVHPLQSIVRPNTLALVNLGQGNSVTLPVVDSKSAATTLAVNSGDVVVLGGLADQATDVNANGVPGLSDTPAVGALFDQTNNGQTSRELVLVLKATLL
ncbi:MAG: pilus (MSHA type) biogenesis protein MshL [Pseudacidovorax sp.]|nr:pilus (MSHA type) biogenesis protein MshL [Pseudacidovorax sp.]